MVRLTDLSAAKLPRWTVAPITSDLSVLLDAFRWLSALAVLAGHLRALMFVDYSSLDRRSAIETLFYFSTSLGHQAVVVFFVLSGFLVGGSGLGDFLLDKFSISRYAVNRISRLYPVLIAGLLLTITADTVGLTYFAGSELYFVRRSYHLNLLHAFNPEVSLGWTVLLGNLAMCQTILTTTFGTDGPLWSLANEFWYYVLFPLLMMSVWAPRPRFRIGAIVLLVFLLWL